MALVEHYESTLFLFDQKAALRFKKVDDEQEPKNYPTRRQTRIKYQQLELEGICRPTVVNVGNRLNAVWTGIVSVSVGCRRGNELIWEIPIAEELQAYMFDAQGNASAIRPPAVRPKREAAENG